MGCRFGFSYRQPSCQGVGKPPCSGCAHCSEVLVSFNGGIEHDPACSAAPARVPLPVDYATAAKKMFSTGASVSHVHDELIKRAGKEMGLPEGADDIETISNIMRHVKGGGEGVTAAIRRVVFAPRHVVAAWKVGDKMKRRLAVKESDAVEAMVKEHADRYLHYRPQDVAGGQALELVVCTEAMVQRARASPQSTLFIDATHGCHKAGFMLAGVYVICPSGACRPVAYIVLERESADAYTRCLTAVKAAIERDPGVTWAPTVAITDADLKITNALTTVLPGTQQWLCTFHVLRAWIKQCNAKCTREAQRNGDAQKAFQELVSGVLYLRGDGPQGDR